MYIPAQVIDFFNSEDDGFFYLLSFQGHNNNRTASVDEINRYTGTTTAVW